MNDFTIFLDDLDVERQVPLFSSVNYDSDKISFIADAIEELKRKGSARNLMGQDRLTSRVFDNKTYLDLRIDSGFITATMNYRPNFRIPYHVKTQILNSDSPVLISELVHFIDTFINVEIVQST
jgi:hypothetical protein